MDTERTRIMGGRAQEIYDLSKDDRDRLALMALLDIVDNLSNINKKLDQLNKTIDWLPNRIR